MAQVYLDAGTHARRLLRSVYHVAPTPFLRQLVDQPRRRRRRHSRRCSGIVEQLSDREILVLRYLPSRLSNPEIARNLYVSVNTLKTHLKHIYRKLGVGQPLRSDRGRRVTRASSEVSHGIVAAGPILLRR